MTGENSPRNSLLKEFWNALSRNSRSSNRTSAPDMLVALLGNPGDEHARARHNVGFRVGSRLLERARAGDPAPKYHGRFWAGASGRRKHRTAVSRHLHERFRTFRRQGRSRPRTRVPTASSSCTTISIWPSGGFASAVAAPPAVTWVYVPSSMPWAPATSPVSSSVSGRPLGGVDPADFVLAEFEPHEEPRRAAHDRVGRRRRHRSRSRSARPRHEPVQRGIRGLMRLSDIRSRLENLPDVAEALTTSRKSPPPAICTRVTPSKPILLAALAARLDRPLILVVPDEARASEMVQDIQAWVSSADVLSMPDPDPARLLADGRQPEYPESAGWRSLPTRHGRHPEGKYREARRRGVHPGSSAPAGAPGRIPPTISHPDPWRRVVTRKTGPAGWPGSAIGAIRSSNLRANSPAAAASSISSRPTTICR